MSGLTIKEKMSLVLKLTKKHDITAYEIGNNTELNASNVYKILNGEIQKPREKTLNIVLKYIEEKIRGSDLPKVSEPASGYKTKDMLIDTQTKLIKQLEKEIDDLLGQIDDLKSEISSLKEQKKTGKVRI